MRVCLSMMVLLLSLLSYAQRENNVWYYGDRVGLDFNSGNPVSLNNNILPSLSACSSICNASGQLLFYSNSTEVRNKNHQVMPNGSGLLGSPASTQSSIIIPKPNSNTIYYLFTNVNTALPIGIRYSEIDITLNGGLGDVTSVKNMPLCAPVCEKICAVKNYADGTYWLVTHYFGNNNFAAFKIDASGVNTTPVISSTGSSIDSTINGYHAYNAQGYLKFSPDGSKLVCVNSYIGVELFDFDITSGQVSHPISINKFCYGAEFSPSGNLLYLGTKTGPASYAKRIYQYNLQATDIPLSGLLVANGNFDFGGLQLASNCKIYIGNYMQTNNSPGLYVINNPDIIGTSCDFQPVNLTFSGRCLIGLPQFVQNSNCKSRIILNDDICLGNNTVFNLGGTDTVLAATWNFGDGSTSNSITGSHQYTTAGTYIVAGDFATPTGNFSISKQIIVPENPVAHPVSDLTFCDATTVNYDLSQLESNILGNQSRNLYGISFFASMNDAVHHQNLLTPIQNFNAPETTIYTKVYRLSNFDCHGISSFKIVFNASPISNPVSEYKICDDGLSNDGYAVFDFNTKTPEVLGNQSGNDFKVSYHLNLADAQQNSNPLAMSYANTSNPQTIYARISTLPSETCYAVTSFDLAVKASPEFELLSQYTLCEESSHSILISIPSIFQSYLWSTGSQTSATTISSAGNYWLTVTQNQGNTLCSRTKNFQVILSNKAVIKKVVLQDWTADSNSIQVLLDPASLGQYEYSLDGLHYQDSNYFENLLPRSYTVYVREKNGCGITTEEVFLLMYPKFFTPNNDGYNDIWSIKFSETEPNLSVTIFDRYGKLLHEGTNWNGKFQGQTLPADDYWFIVKRENGKQYKGHFALKR